MNTADLSHPAKASGESFSPRVVLALLLVAVFATAGFLVLSAHAPELEAASSGGANVLSSSAAGYAGTARLLEFADQPVWLSRSPTAIQGYEGLMVLTPERGGGLDGVGAHGVRLIVLPKWSPAPDPDHAGWTAEAPVLPPGLVLGVLPKALAAGARLERRAPGVRGPARLTGRLDQWPTQGRIVGPVASFQTLAGGSLTPALTDEMGREVLGVAPGGRVFVLSDPDLLNTQGMADVRTARAGVALLLSLHHDRGPIAFDATLIGQLGRSLLRAAVEPPFLGATLCLVAAAGLTGVTAWNRFGRPSRAGRAIAFGKLALVENGANMMRFARREPQMAQRYVQLCRRRAAAALGAERLQGPELDAFLDRWAGRIGTGERITALEADARQVKDLNGLAALARRARDWRLEMTRGSV